MAGLLYFLTGEKRGIKLEQICAMGLAHAFEEGRCTPAEVTHGPNGRAGVLLADDHRVPSHRIRYQPDAQSWRQIPKTQVWLGYYREDRPRPQELARATQLPGHLVTLADRQRWLVPVARGLSELEDDPAMLGWYSALPQSVGLDEDGNWAQDGHLPRYAGLWPVAQAWWDALSQAVEDEARGNRQEAKGESEPRRITFDFRGVNDAALTALAANYCVGKAEIALLGLFDDQSVRNVLNALVDWPTMTQWLKKKAAAGGSPTASGPADAPAATIPR